MTQIEVVFGAPCLGIAGAMAIFRAIGPVDGFAVTRHGRQGMCIWGGEGGYPYRCSIDVVCLEWGFLKENLFSASDPRRGWRPVFESQTPAVCSEPTRMMGAGHGKHREGGTEEGEPRKRRGKIMREAAAAWW